PFAGSLPVVALSTDPLCGSGTGATLPPDAGLPLTPPIESAVTGPESLDLDGPPILSISLLSSVSRACCNRSLTEAPLAPVLEAPAGSVAGVESVDTGGIGCAPATVGPAASVMPAAI